MTSSPLPPLRERRRQSTQLEMSAVAGDLFLARGLAATTIADIATAAGVSTRTFHRYFPTKADALGPELHVGLGRYLDAVATVAADLDLDGLLDELADALTGVLRGPTGVRDTALLHLTVTTPELLPVWLRTHEECARALVPLLTARLRGAPDPMTTRFLSGSIVLANRLAVEAWVVDGGDVQPLLRRSLHLLRTGRRGTDGTGAGSS